MASANRGTKRRCASCGAAFYDLNRAPITCPKCQAAYVAAPRLPIKPSRSRTAEPVLPEPVEAEAFEEDEVLEHTDEADEGDMPPEMDGDEEELRE